MNQNNTEKSKIYLISQDVERLMSMWAKSRNFILPPSRFFDCLTSELSKQLHELFAGKVFVKCLKYEELANGVEKLLKKYQPDFTVSLDSVYIPQANAYIEINRMISLVDGKWQSIGEGPRPNYPDLDQQLKEIPLANHEVIIVSDDGCWSGGSLNKMIKKLEVCGSKVKAVVVGILVECDEAFAGKSLIDPCFIYQKNDLVDWLCERDFYFGVPLAGRTLGFLDSDGCAKPVTGNVGVPYLFGYGDPIDWASLDVSEEILLSFSIARLQQSIKLFEEIELQSSKIVTVEDIDRKPYLGYDPDPAERFVEVLKKEVYRWQNKLDEIKKERN